MFFTNVLEKLVWYKQNEMKRNNFTNWHKNKVPKPVRSHKTKNLVITFTVAFSIVTFFSSLYPIFLHGPIAQAQTTSNLHGTNYQWDPNYNYIRAYGGIFATGFTRNWTPMKESGPNSNIYSVTFKCNTTVQGLNPTATYSLQVPGGGWPNSTQGTISTHYSTGCSSTYNTNISGSVQVQSASSPALFNARCWVLERSSARSFENYWVITAKISTRPCYLRIASIGIK